MVVVWPAKNGKAPHTPHPIAPIKNICLYSCFMKLKFFFKDPKVNGKRIKKTNNHLQNAKEIGGTYSTPPLATIKLLAMKTGWIKSNKNGNKLFFELFTVLKCTNFYQRKLRTPS